MAELRRVSDNVVCIRRSDYLTCSYAVRIAGGIVLIDGGMDPSGDEALSAVAELGAQPNHLKAILVTHWHQDHSAGLAALRTRTGARIYAHAREVPFLRGETARKGIIAGLARRIPEWSVLVLVKGVVGEALDRPVAPDATVADGEVVEGFAAIATPGHTPGHMSWFLPEGRILFAGDALAVVRGRLRFMARPVTPDLPAARESMRRLLQQPAEVICPGHREPLANATAERERLLRAVESGAPWPLFG